MARGVNKFIGIGNACSDTESKDIAGGGRVSSVNLAMGDAYKDKITGELVDKTEFIRITFFNKLADVANAYIKKGDKIYIEGKIQTRKYQASDGSDRYSTGIVVNYLQLLDKNPNNAEGNGASVQSKVGNSFDDSKDDDIPF